MKPPGPRFPVGGDLTTPAPIPDALAAVLNAPPDEDEERVLLREVCKRVDALDAVLVFRGPNGIEESSRHPSGRVHVRAEVSIDTWDDLMDAVADVARYDMDREDGPASPR